MSDMLWTPGMLTAAPKLWLDDESAFCSLTSWKLSLKKFLRVIYNTKVVVSESIVSE